MPLALHGLTRVSWLPLHGGWPGDHEVWGTGRQAGGESSAPLQQVLGSRLAGLSQALVVLPRQLSQVLKDPWRHSLGQLCAGFVEERTEAQQGHVCEDWGGGRKRPAEGSSHHTSLGS